MLVSEYCSNCDKKTMRKTSECPECTPKNVEAQNSTPTNNERDVILSLLDKALGASLIEEYDNVSTFIHAAIIKLTPVS